MTEHREAIKFPIPLRPSDILLDQAQLELEKFIPKNARKWLAEIIDNKGEVFNIFDTLHEIVTGGSVDLPSGYKEYPFFTERDDDFVIFGLTRPINEIVVFLEKCRDRGRSDSMLLLVAPSAGGKSTLVNALRKGFEDHTQDNPIDIVEGCPVNCSPLKLLPPDLRRKIKEEFGLHVDGDCCAHCEELLQKRLKENSFSLAKALEKINVTPVAASSKGKFVGKIEPKISGNSDSSEVLAKVIKKAAGGILEFAELGLYDPDALKKLNDLLREDRFLDQDGNICEVPTFKVGHMTEEEWIKFKKSEEEQGRKSILERTVVVLIQFNLSVSEEVRMYKKFLAETKKSSQIHIPPEALRVLAEFAVRSRLKDSKRPGLTIDKKLRLFNKEDVIGFRQEELKEIEKEGLQIAEETDKREGFFGFSPVVMKRIIDEVLGKSERCLSPLTALTRLKDYFDKRQDIDLREKTKYLELVKKTRGSFEERLKGMVLRSFVENFDRKCQKIYDEYFDNLEALKGGNKIKDSISGEDKEPDLLLLKQIEDLFYAHEGINPTDVQREEFKSKVFKHNVSRGKITFEPLTFDKTLPELKMAIEKMALGDTKPYIEILKSILGRPTPDQEKRLAQVETVFSERYGFKTSCCSRELMRCAASLF